MPRPDIASDEERLSVVTAYHERTKHQLHRYAHAPGRMDWASEPDPFRRYLGSRLIALQRPPVAPRPTYDSLFAAGPAATQSLNRRSVSCLFYDSLALSAWKQAPGTESWSLRVNPSSGDLHPTEAYLLAGPVQGLSTDPALYHYAPREHALECRCSLPAPVWAAMVGDDPTICLIAMTSIYWREVWKYGERAYRYCHLDIGHALGAVSLAAAMLGWQTSLLPISDDALAVLVGITDQSGVEAEHPACLLALHQKALGPGAFRLTQDVQSQLEGQERSGTPNQLSRAHRRWPIIDEVAQAARRGSPPAQVRYRQRDSGNGGHTGTGGRDRKLSARQIIRQRRSCLALDGRTSIERALFYDMMSRVMPGAGRRFFRLLPWPPCVSLAVFVHRVSGLSPGLYLLVRDRRHKSLQEALRGEFEWRRPPECPGGLPLHVLRLGDYRQTAGIASCHQDIASNGAFALAMLARFKPALTRYGSSFYARLHWEAGLIGQILYLEAEAAGLRATGIGCFFDDVTHEVLGIPDHTWQVVYHFTLGGNVDDPRLKTLDPYHHLGAGR